MEDKYFQIEITQTISRVLEIRAVDLESAINDVREQFNDGLITMEGSTDAVSVSYNVKEWREDLEKIKN